MANPTTGHVNAPLCRCRRHHDDPHGTSISTKRSIYMHTLEIHALSTMMACRVLRICMYLRSPTLSNGDAHLYRWTSSTQKLYQHICVRWQLETFARSTMMSCLRTCMPRQPPHLAIHQMPAFSDAADRVASLMVLMCQHRGRDRCQLETYAWPAMTTCLQPRKHRRLPTLRHISDEHLPRHRH